MPGYLVTTSATVQCTHGGSVKAVPGAPRVKVAGSPVVTAGDVHLVSGCPFVVQVGAATKAQPCIQTAWIVKATRVKVAGQPVILSTSAGMCKSAEQIPQATPSVMVVQQKVKGI